MKKLLSASICIVLMLGLSAGTVSGQDAQNAIAYVQANAGTLGLTADDVSGMIVSDDYTSRGITHVYLQQAYGGIGVRNALINYVRKGNRVKVTASTFIPKLDSRITGSIPSMGAVGAAEAAAGQLGLVVTEPLRVLASTPGAAQATTLSRGGVALEDIKAELMYQALENGEVRLAWNVGIYTLDANHYWEVRVDAASGVMLDVNDLVVHDYWGGPIVPQHDVSPMIAPFAAAVTAPSTPAASQLTSDDYFVFPLPSESPLHPVGGGTAQSTESDAWMDGGVGLPDGASPFGWHDTNGAAGPEFTDTRGNNVDAYQDQANSSIPGGPGNAPRPADANLHFNEPFDFGTDPTSTTVNDNPEASVVNLFYWNNIIHDVQYKYGFDEASGNFQVNNYGRGGAGNDDVRAEGQDGGGNCNANMLTLPDGSRPRMQMYLCTNASPRRDGDLDHGVIIHEYVHGTSIRLTGGPANTGCLSGSEQAGEGWSDWYGLVMSMQVGDVGPTARGIGTYLFGQPPDGPGIRPRPYSTSFAVNDFTYDNLKTAAVPHGVGHVWATMTWDLVWALIGGDPNIGTPGGDDGAGGGSGFDPDFYNGTGGNNLAMALITEGMKQQGCLPGFVDSRDGILDADTLITGGLNSCAIWHTFARRGLGFSADQGPSSPPNRSDGTEAFDLPPGVPANPADCGGAAPAFTISINKLKRTATGVKKAKMRWTAGDVSTNKVDFYVAVAPALPTLDGNPKNEPGGKRTANDGKTAVKLKLADFPTDGPFNIQACEKKSTTVCSNMVVADFTGIPIDFNEPENDPDDDEAAAKNGIPESFALNGTFPNPFNPTTRIEFDLPERAEVRVAIYDMLGRQVMVLPAQTFEAGANRGLEVNASRLASGTYLYRLTAAMEGDLQVATGRMVLVK